jgi:hypothetical protein
MCPCQDTRVLPADSSRTLVLGPWEGPIHLAGYHTIIGLSSLNILPILYGNSCSQDHLYIVQRSRGILKFAAHSASIGLGLHRYK